MGVGLDNYKFGRKNNWRRWAWNQAKSRISVKSKDAIVLYLPSKQNLDMEVAKQKGFRPWNMFAVERDPQIIKQLRQQGVNVIEGDFNDVLMAWGDSPKIDIILADFCGGLTKIAENFALSLVYSQGIKAAPQQTIICGNFLRGRDNNKKLYNPETNCYDCTLFDYHKNIITQVTNEKNNDNTLSEKDAKKIANLESEQKKHRGVMFLHHYYVKMVFGTIAEAVSLQHARDWLKEFEKQVFYAEQSYKSVNEINVFDSIVFNTFSVFNISTKALVEYNHIEKTRQRVAAAKAHRKRKLPKSVKRQSVFGEL